MTTKTTVTEICKKYDIHPSMFYNSARQLSSVKDNSGKTRNFVYDLAGNQIETSIQINDTNLIETTKNEYDLFNRLTKVISSKNEITSYTYLPTGQLSTIIDPK